MWTITVRIDLVARAGKQHELLDSILALTSRIAKETGCKDCRAYQNTDNKDEFVVLERWENEKRVQAHLDSENLAVLAGAGSVLSSDLSVSLSKEPSIADMEQIFKKRMEKK